jgi:transcription elongation factor GreA
MDYIIVSDNEADLKEGKIAVSTPIAKGLLGKKVGDVVEIKVPSGIIPFEIIEISK